MPMTYAQIGQQMKQKYPQYANFADDVVGQKVAAKYPQYQKLVGDTTQSSSAAPAAPKDNQVLSTLQKIGSGAENLLLPGVQQFGRSLGNAAANTMTGGAIEQQRQEDLSGQDKLLKVALDYQKRGDSANAQRIFGLLKNRSSAGQSLANQQLQEATKGKGEAIRGALGTAADIIGMSSGIGGSTGQLSKVSGGLAGINAPLSIIKTGADAGIPARVGAGIVNMLPANIIRGAAYGAAQEGSTPASTAKSAEMSALVGSALEGLTQGVFPAVGKAFNWTKEGLNVPADKIQSQLDAIPRQGKIAQVGEGILNQPVSLPGVDDATVEELIHPTNPQETVSNLEEAIREVHKSKADIIGSLPASSDHAQKFQDILNEIKDASLNAPTQGEKIQMDNLSHQLERIYSPQPTSSAEAIDQTAGELSGMIPQEMKGTTGAAATSAVTDTTGTGGLGQWVVDKKGNWSFNGPSGAAEVGSGAAVDPSLQVKVPGIEQLQKQVAEKLSPPPDEASLSDLEKARQILGEHVFEKGKNPDLQSVYFDLRDYIRKAAGNPQELQAIDNSSTNLFTAKGALNNYFDKIGQTTGKAGATIPTSVSDPEALKKVILSTPVPNRFSRTMGPVAGAIGGLTGLSALKGAGVLPATMGAFYGMSLGSRAGRSLFEDPAVIQGLSNILNQTSEKAGPAASALASPALSRLLGPLLSAGIVHQQEQTNPTP